MLVAALQAFFFPYIPLMAYMPVPTTDNLLARYAMLAVTEPINCSAAARYKKSWYGRRATVLA